MSGSEWGSPPHVRGKEVRLFFLFGLLRITPACAGKSWSNALPCSRREDHPRVCGEKLFVTSALNTASGSPPRMRGKAEGKAEIARTLRITPAYAGKSTPATAWAPLRRDHPRMCGEKSTPVSASVCSSGSPPHVRGKAAIIKIISSFAGITPAYAGKRIFS